MGQCGGVGHCRAEGRAMLRGGGRAIAPKEHLATCTEARSFVGIRVRQVGAVYAVDQKSVVGRIDQVSVPVS